MTELDEALEKYIADDNQQAQYYELLLNTDFYIPIVDDGSNTPIEKRESVTPLVFESDDKHYVLMFDTEERVNNWSQEPIKYMLLAGYELAKHTPANIHWALNIGTERGKEFVPEEIAFLKTLTK